ncbi:hypothetical protein F2Q69_00029406 [Brassica cretica]|uniref:Uncharacterized protein n=1 Tax=Brassica cretica TaxID=69181 RepID=A0A8S9RZL5_BRACR|nr:hypothetical protein F2Q69_00029406 [Brassica cretica]
MVVPEALYNRRSLLQKKLRVKWGYHKTRKKKLSVQKSLVKALRELDQKESDRKYSGGRHMEQHYGLEEKQSCRASHSNHVWKPGRISLKLPGTLWSLVGETGFENKYWLQQVHRWEKVQKIIKLLYGQEMVQRQHSYKNTPLLPSEFTHGMFQLPRPPELFLFMVRSRPWITIKLEVWKVQSTSRATLSPIFKSRSQVYGGFSSIKSVRTGCMKLVKAEAQVQGGGNESEILRMLSRAIALFVEIASADLRTSRISNGGVLLLPGRSVLAHDFALSDDGETRDGSSQQKGLLHLGHNRSEFRWQLNPQGSLSKNGYGSGAYSSRGMSDALVNHTRERPTRGKLRIMVAWEEPFTMESSGEHSAAIFTHKLFHLPRPPRAFSCNLHPQSCSHILLELMRLISTTWEAVFMALIKTEGGSNGDTTNGWKCYRRYSMYTTSTTMT